MVEAIKGDTPIGTVLNLPELTPPNGDTTSLADVAALADPWNPRLHPELTRTDVLPSPPLRAADRMIVFLREAGAPSDLDLGKPKASVIGWQPANFWEELRASTIWLQDGRSYGYGQSINPGYSHLLLLRVTEDQIRQQIRSVLDLRSAMDRALGTADPAGRAKQLAALVRSDFSLATASALSHLAAGGADALAELEAMLVDPNLSPKYPLIAGALAKIHTPDIHLAQILDRETRFWTGTCPILQGDWFKTAPAQTVEAPETHYMIAGELLTLDKLQSAPDRAAVMAFAQVWKTCPPMNERRTDQISPEIDRLLSTGR